MYTNEIKQHKVPFSKTATAMLMEVASTAAASTK